MELSQYMNGNKSAHVSRKSMMYEVSFFQDGVLRHISKCFSEQEAENLAEDFVKGATGPSTLLNETVSNG
jgi:hypothetical protein